VMERDQPEWVRRFGARMRTEHAPPINNPLPQLIVAKLQALEDTERRLRVRDSQRTKGETLENAASRSLHHPNTSLPG
jgi:hypothetical protein